jgi:MFS family permease
LKHKLNLYAITLNSLLSGFRMNLINAIWQPFVLSFGVSMSSLGLVESFSGHRGIVPALAQAIGGWLSDRRGRKPIIVWGSILTFLYLGLCLLAFYLRDWRYILPAVFFLGLSAYSRPARDSMVADSVKAGELGVAYSLVMAAFLLPGIFAPAMGGLMADKLGFGSVFALGLVLEALAVLPIVVWAQETIVYNPPTKGLTLKRFSVPAHLLPFYATTAADFFSWGLGYGIIYGMLAKTYGLSSSQIGLIVSASSIAWLVFQMPAGKLVDRFGGFRLMVISEVLGIPLMIGWLFARSMKAFILLQILWGLVAATWVPAMQSYIALKIPKEERGEAMGLLSAFRGIVSFPSPLLGGLLYEVTGISGPILANLAGIIVTIAMFLFWVKE